MNLLDKIFYKYNSSISKAQAEHEQQAYWNSVARNIAPVTIEEHFSGKYIIINGTTYARCIIAGIPKTTINGYPQGLSENMVTRLMNLSAYGSRISISFYLSPIPPETATKIIQKSEFYNQIQQNDSKIHNAKYNKVKMADLHLDIDHDHNIANFRSIMENRERLFHSAFIIVFRAKSEDDLQSLESDVRTILESEMVQYESPDYAQKETYISAMPYNQIHDFTQIEILSPYAAVLTTARNPNSRTDDKGLFFGFDRHTNKSIMVDIDALAAQHLLGVGATGSGKTFTLLMLLMRAQSMLNRRIIYCTPKADTGTNHRAVVDYLGDGAELIDIGPNGHNINPMQILYDRQQMKDNINEYIRTYNNHKGILTKFLEVWFEGTSSINMANFIDYSLNEVYEAAGIYREIPETWHSAKWPVLNDLIKFWEKELKAADKEDRKTIKAILNKTFSLGEKGILEYMNQPTNIDLSKDFIIFDLSGTPDIIKDAMNVLITGILGQRFRTDTQKHTIIAIDEARIFLQNPRLSSFLMTALTQGRSAKIALWLLTQQATDLIKSGVAEEFQTNVFLKLILGNNMGKDNIQHVSDYFGLDSTDRENLLSSGVGDGLLIIGDSKTPVEFRPTKLEDDIIKGAYLRNDKMATVPELSELDDRIIDLVMIEGLCLESWNPGITVKGWQRQQVANAFGAGMITAWIRDVALPFNQTIDHFATVIQIAGALMLSGIREVKINHYDDADIVVTTYPDDEGPVTWAIEYERAGIHTEDQLIEKKIRMLSNYNNVMFICASTYYTKLSRILGDEFVIRRGQTLADFIQSI